MFFPRTLVAAMLCLALSPAQAKQTTHAEQSKPKVQAHKVQAHKTQPHKTRATKAEQKAEKKRVVKPDQPWRMVASVYWEGTRVATGRRFDPNGMTVAHKTLPLGTRLLVTYSGSIVEVVVNDRGPFVHGRDIDLTRGVAKVLHFSGLGRVRVAYWPPLPAERPSSAPPRPVPPVEISETY
jgi:rare lipoprotein A